MKKVITVAFILLTSSQVYSQEIVMNFGYQESEHFSGFLAGVTRNNFDITILVGLDVDLGDDSNTIIGSRFAYLFYLLRDGGTSIYLGPHIGGYYLERSSLSNGSNYVDEGEFSLNYGGTAGLYVGGVNLSIDYGYDDAFETTYFGAKIGFDFFKNI